jgi:hypothetical protein
MKLQKHLWQVWVYSSHWDNPWFCFNSSTYRNTRKEAIIDLKKHKKLIKQGRFEKCKIVHYKLI